MQERGKTGRKGSTRKKGLRNQETHQVMWRPQRSSGSETNQPKRGGGCAQGRTCKNNRRKPGPLDGRKGLFSGAAAGRARGRKGSSQGRWVIANHTHWGSLFSAEQNDLQPGRAEPTLKGRGSPALAGRQRRAAPGCKCRL